MKLAFKFGLLLLLLGVFSSVLANGGEEFTKIIKKEFEITPDGTAIIHNKYGKVDIRTWNRNRVKIEVTIEVKTSSESNANKVFDRIGISFSNSRNYVKAETTIEPKKKEWWNWTSSKSDYSINYEVFVPTTINLELRNKYGDVFAEETEGKLTIDVKYGNFTLDGIGDDCNITLAYCNGTLAKTRNLVTTASYSKLHIGEVKDVEIISKHSVFKVDKAGDIRSVSKYDVYDLREVRAFRNTGKYDDIKIGLAESVVVGSKYTNLDIVKLEKNLDLDLEYGGASIEQIAKGFSDIDLKGRHSDFKLKLESGASYRINAVATYAGIRYPEDLVVTFEIEKGTQHELEGHIGSENAAAVIKARLNYGGLRVRQE